MKTSIWVTAVVSALATMCDVAAARSRVSSSQNRTEVAYSLFFQPLVITESSTGSAIGMSAKIDANLWVDVIRVVGVDGMLHGTYLNSARFKQFLGNSFYLAGGVAERKLYGVTTRGWTTSLGNQWQWSSLTLGGEWFGVYVPTSGGSKPRSPAVKLASFVIGVAF